MAPRLYLPKFFYMDEPTLLRIFYDHHGKEIKEVHGGVEVNVAKYAGIKAGGEEVWTPKRVKFLDQLVKEVPAISTLDTWRGDELEEERIFAVLAKLTIPERFEAETDSSVRARANSAKWNLEMFLDPVHLNPAIRLLLRHSLREVSLEKTLIIGMCAPAGFQIASSTDRTDVHTGPRSVFIEPIAIILPGESIKFHLRGKSFREIIKRMKPLDKLIERARYSRLL